MLIEQWLLDLRLACRRLGRAKGFTSAAVLTLAVGIGGTTVMFALIQGVLLRPLPVHEQDRVVVAWKELRSSGFTHYPFGDVEIAAVAEASKLFERVAGVTRNGVGRWVAVEDGVSSYVNGAFVTGSFFDVLGIEPILGRALTRRDGLDGAENVLVISHGLWQRRYGGSPDAIGRRVTLSERLFTIVGVMPPDVDYPNGVEMWRTTSSLPIAGFGGAARREVDLIARLRPGVTVAQATAELTALTRRFEAEAPPTAQRGLMPIVRSFEEVVVGDVRSAIVALFAAVGLVLIIASANAANLLLMRGEARRPELAVCEALGAGRGRIVRQLFAESLVLALAAGAAGLAVTWWSLQGLMTLVPNKLPRVDSIHIDMTVVFFTIATALITAALAGLAPALSLVRADLMSQLRSGGRGVTGSATRHGRQVLVVAQVALAVTIVAAAGLLTRSLLRLQSVDVGLATDRLVFVDLALPPAKYADSARHARFLDEVTSQLQAVPAITAATPVNVPPFSGIQGWDVPTFTAEGQSADRAAMNSSLNLESVHPNYFETFEVTLLRGRAFTSADRQGMLDVAIVSEDVAARTWPGQNPIGKRLKMGGPDSNEGWRTIVGVAAPTRYRELAAARSTLYLPAAQFLATAQMLVLRTTASLDLVASLSRNRVRSVDPDVQVMSVVPFAEMLARPLARPRFNAFLFGIFGIAALLLATIGLYAVMSAYVRHRTPEIGIRVALGATSADVRRLVVGEGLQLAGLGTAIGLAGALASTRLLGGLLFEVRPLDPAALLAAVLLLIVASALACYLPARRATRVDPVVMLRAN